VRAAVEDANRQTRELLERALPRDRDLGLGGETVFDRMMRSHDADLKQELGEVT
jgi:hypothetical protein